MKSPYDPKEFGALGLLVSAHVETDTLPARSGRPPPKGSPLSPVRPRVGPLPTCSSPGGPPVMYELDGLPPLSMVTTAEASFNARKSSLVRLSNPCRGSLRASGSSLSLGHLSSSSCRCRRLVTIRRSHMERDRMHTRCGPTEPHLDAATAPYGARSPASPDRP